MFDSLVYSEDRRIGAIVIGAIIGSLSGVLALLVALLGPVMAFGFVLGIAVALYILTDLEGALLVMVGVIAMLPFATVPFQLAVTPTLLDGALSAFLVVYLFQWMSGRRQLLHTTPVTPIALAFTGLMLFAFLMGLRHAPLEMRVLRSVAEMIMSLLLIPVLIDAIADIRMLRRIVLAFMLLGAASAALGIWLWLLPDFTAEGLLNRLGRLGYPVGGVIRYRETPGALLNERAIGTWIDPNAFGGFLLMVGALIAPQVFSAKPLVDRRLAVVMLGAVAAALFLTDSRGAMLSLTAAFVFIAALRYRRLLLVMAAVGVVALFMPFTQRYVDKLEAGFRNADVETQMRFGEYKDALQLIGRHPVVGVGFSGTPEIDLYLGVANTYLTIASHAGLLGLAGYLLMMGSAFVYSLTHYARIQALPALADVWLGLAAGVVGAMAGGVFDHFYFKIDQFHATMTALWILLGLMLAAVRLAAEQTVQATADSAR